MKKLKIKVFATILAIFTFFLLFILLIFNYQDYQREKNKIESNLIRLSNGNFKVHDRDNNKNLQINNLENKEPLDHKIFMDYTVYTVLISDGYISEIISHDETENKEEKISQIATQIMNQNKRDVLRIGNLYFSNYSYLYQVDSFIIIMDNTATKDFLLEHLKSTILLFTGLEILAIFLSNIITKFLTKPVISSFTKQKQFIADASHELKTPISVILASAEILEKDQNKKWIRNIKSEAERMSKLVTDLLDLARLENREISKIYEIVDLSKLIEMEALTFEGLAYESDLSIECDIENHIMLKCDSDSIKQLLTILLDNAIKHSYKGEIIQVKLQREKKYIILEVINKGDPIPVDSSEKIFERFYRGDISRNRNSNRYGLGLAIAKNIVVHHHGKITAISKDGFTMFKIVFK